MADFNARLMDILRLNVDFVDENNNIIKEKVINSALKHDEKLLELLLNNEESKNYFFKNINNCFVFNKDKFIKFISKRYLFHSFTDFKNKIGLNINGKYVNEIDDVSLVWPFKDCVLEGGMSKGDTKRNEIFFNEIIHKDEIDKLLDPKVLSNFKKFSVEGCSDSFKFNVNNNLIKDNLILKGNNLLALHTIKSKFRNQIKLIFIDPPFNTEGDEFMYNDKFSHSTWLTFMKNRLEVAKELMKDDGLIFVELDYNEVSYLKVLMDDIFGRDNYINTISVKSSSSSGTKTSHTDKTIIKTQDFILVYAKNKNLIKFKPQYTKKEKWDSHYSWYIQDNGGNLNLISLTDKLKEEGIFKDKDTLRKNFDINNPVHKMFYKNNGDYIVRKSTHNNKEIKSICNNEYKDKIYKQNGYFYFNNDMLQPISKSFHEILVGKNIENDISNVLCDRWDDIDFQNTQNQGVVKFPKGKKPEQLLYRIIDMSTKEGDIVLDFFLGSGTTCAVAHKMNRQYIGIEQLDYGENDSIIRLNAVIGEKDNDGKIIKFDKSGMSEALNWNGGGEFIYCELTKYNESAIISIKNAKSTNEILEIWDDICNNYFLNYDVDIYKFNKHLEDFQNYGLINQKELLLEFLNKNQLYVNLSDIDDINFNIDESTKDFNKLFYNVEGF